MRLLIPNRLVTILSVIANSMASSRIFPRLLYTLLSLLVALFLASCGDPGTGGSGIPSGVGVGSPSDMPTNSPTNGVSNAPPTSSGGIAPVLRVESLDSNSVTIGGVRYSASQIEVSLADSSAGNFASLVVGQAVLVTEVQATAGASSTRWKLTIQAQP